MIYILDVIKKEGVSEDDILKGEDITENHFHGVIGLLKDNLKINKDWYDEWWFDSDGEIKKTTEPKESDFDCKPPEAVQATDDGTTKEPTEPVEEEIVYDDYLEIIFENTINDLKIKYKTPIKNEIFTSATVDSAISLFFNLNLKESEEIYSHPNMIQLKNVMIKMHIFMIVILI